ncbi:hypothetical protein [Salinilacihabitans rarus]|nr:hypothetical protein [Salinilacihabitans rarus]
MRLSSRGFLYTAPPGPDDEEDRARPETPASDDATDPARSPADD